MARLSVLIIACLTLAGCALPPPKTLLSLTCPQAGGKCENDIVASGSLGVCPSSVKFDEIRFTRGKNDITVRWTAPDGYGFCPQLGDGVFLKGTDPDDQFGDPKAEGPHGSGPCNKKQFTLLARNTKPRPTEPYLYSLKFHNNAGTQTCLIDPAMYND
jgi:hypothetical protein